MAGRRVTSFDCLQTAPAAKQRGRPSSFEDSVLPCHHFSMFLGSGATHKRLRAAPRANPAALAQPSKWRRRESNPRKISTACRARQAGSVKR
jgi:hypothetical protein